ncbi:hypothetical protein EDB84DRAFT_1566079 [Lactarius hengduanensis]|nr:hypothetical protein EDB84DRAFT_1566079 [Lactarius hengduanensis]
MSPRPSRKIIPTAKLTADNAGELELSSHRKAVASASAASKVPPPISLSTSSPLPDSSPPPQTDTDDALSLATDLSEVRSSSKRPSQAIRSSLSLDSITVLSHTTSDAGDDNTPKSKKTKTSPASGVQEPSHILPDVSIIEIDDIDNPQDERLNKSDPSADIKFFFTTVPRLPGQAKRRMKCNLCT